MARSTIALLFGGRSGEHEVSLRSAAAVAAGLSGRHDVLPVLIDRRGRWWLQAGTSPSPDGGSPVFLAPSPEDHGALRLLANAREAAQPDVYFPLLHGTFGEDGTIQGLLELASVPYVGAGVAASAAAMDKELMKAVFAAAGLPQVRYRCLRERGDPALADAGAGIVRELGLPLFVKPANLGSSVGVSKVSASEALTAAVELAFAYDRKVLVEAASSGREIEVAVLGNEIPEASLPGEIVPDRDFYDYDSKYSSESRTELRIPAELPQPVADAVRALSIQAFRALDACGYARVDFFLEASGRILVNEINTIPGFTSISMFPKLWEATGLAYPDLLDRLLTLAEERHQQRRRLRTDRQP
jgi:D-alanine-D-alanine ligase